MAIAAVLFDVDGTLVDSNYHHTLAWSRALRAHGHVIPLASIHRLVGMGGSELLATLIGRSDESIEEQWRARFEELLPEVSAFECAGELLRAWDARGPRILLATSSPKELLDEMRARIDADDVVADMVTATDVEHAKPHPQIFDAALAKSGVARDEAIVVGDSVWDVTSAARAGLRCIGLESGGYSRLELEHAGVAAVYRDPEDLLGHLDDWK